MITRICGTLYIRVYNVWFNIRVYGIYFNIGVIILNLILRFNIGFFFVL